MPGFDALYKQTITLFNRERLPDDDVLWHPSVIECVHLITSSASAWTTRGERNTDNARLHIRYTPSGSDALIICKGEEDKPAIKRWLDPKVWRRSVDKEGNLTFAFGDAEVFDFFIEGIYEDASEQILDSSFDRRGFYDYMNAHYDGVYAITSVSKYNLIPHFEIMAR